MDNKDKHITNSNDNSRDSHKLLNELEIPWTRSKDEVWNELSEAIEDIPQTRVRRIYPVVIRYAIAASIVILFGIGIFIRFYKQEIYCPAGGRLTIILPCESEVELNANSTLARYSRWWKFSRKLTLEGEAYFKVKKGKKFEIMSELGKTTVLGTNFNIYSRQEHYKVTCISGSVSVSSEISDKKVILKSNESVDLDKYGNLTLHQNINSAHSTAWTNDKFFFTSKPLREVLDEIERQYDVSIDIPEKMDLIYTGNFAKEETVDSTLDIICKSLGISFVKQNEFEYLVIQNR